jgi:hypothetical protein
MWQARKHKLIAEHEVVPQIHGIPSPGDEVIDVGCRWRERCVTVKAPAPLNIEQDGVRRPKPLEPIPT